MALHLPKSRSCKVCVVMDSEYVFLRATEKALKWRASGWVGSRGPSSNASLWVELLLSSMSAEVLWIRAPSHMGLEGNGIANGLVVVGNHGPLWELVSGRVGRVWWDGPFGLVVSGRVVRPL